MIQLLNRDQITWILAIIGQHMAFNKVQKPIPYSLLLKSMVKCETLTHCSNHHIYDKTINKKQYNRQTATNDNHCITGCLA